MIDPRVGTGNVTWNILQLRFIENARKAKDETGKGHRAPEPVPAVRNGLRKEIR